MRDRPARHDVTTPAAPAPHPPRTADQPSGTARRADPTADAPEADALEADASELAVARRPRWSRRDRWGLVLSGAVVVVGSLLMASSGWFDAPPRPGRPVNLTSSPRTVDDIATGLTRWLPTKRAQAPNLSGETLTGSHLSLRQFRGQVVVLNAWGSWCAPCRAEAPDLRRVATETRAQGAQFIGIDTRDNAPAARAFVAKYRIPYPSLIDDGSLLLALRDTVPAQAIPATIVLDREGRVAARVVGRVRYSTLRGLVDDALAEPLVPPGPR